MAIYSKDVEGLEQLIKDFDRLGDAAMPYLENAINYSNKLLYRAVLSKIRNRTGALAKAISIKAPRVSKSAKKLISGALLVRKTSECDYGIFVELGHNISKTKRTGDDHSYGTNTLGYVEGKPFLRPAADENKETVATILTISMERAIREVMK